MKLGNLPENLLDWCRILATSLTVVVAVVGIFIASFEFKKSNEITRVSESLSLHRQFLGIEANGKSFKGLQEALEEKIEELSKEDPVSSEKICDFYNSIHNPQNNEVSCEENEIRLFGDLIFKNPYLSNQYLTFYFRESYSNLDISRAKVIELLGHYNSVVVCVNHKGCDENTIRILYAQEMIKFISMFCMYLNRDAEQRKLVSKPAYTPIVEYLKTRMPNLQFVSTENYCGFSTNSQSDI